MSEIPKCKLCDNYPVNYHTGAFGVKHHCGDKHCTLHNVLFTEQQWRTLMGEPVAFMLPFGDGTFTFEKTLPDYVEDIQVSDWLPLYTRPPAQEWVKFDYEDPPEDGVYWLEVEYPEYDVDVDDYGKTVGQPTGKTGKTVFLGSLDMFDDNPDGEPDTYAVIEDVTGEQRPDVDWVITRYAKPSQPE